MPNAKLLYGEITALANQKGFCFASNRYFADLYGCDERQVRRWITQLSDLGFIRVTIDKSAGNQRHIFVKDSLPLRTKKSGGTDKKVLTYGQKSPNPQGEKVHHNNTVNTTGSNTVSRDARAEKSFAFENQKKEKAPPVSAAAPPTTFQESIWATATTGAFAQALHEYDPTTVDADAGYYKQRCRDWSEQNLHKQKRNWLAFAAQIISDDRTKQKLVTLQPTGHANNRNQPDPTQQPIDSTSLVQRSRAIAERLGYRVGE
jgi:hypothetical protein